MPVTLYTSEEVEPYTRMLAKAYEFIRDDPATPIAQHNMLHEIEKLLGWKGPPPMKAKPADPDAAARKLYTADCDNHPTIHSNRFAAWDELDEAAKTVWRHRAAHGHG